MNAAEGETVYAGQDEEDDTDARECEPAILDALHELVIAGNNGMGIDVPAPWLS